MCLHVHPLSYRMLCVSVHDRFLRIHFTFFLSYSPSKWLVGWYQIHGLTTTPSVPGCPLKTQCLLLQPVTVNFVQLWQFVLTSFQSLLAEIRFSPNCWWWRWTLTKCNCIWFVQKKYIRKPGFQVSERSMKMVGDSPGLYSHYLSMSSVVLALHSCLW